MTTTGPTTEGGPLRRAARPLSRMVFLGGAIAIGLFFFRASPRDVTLVYGQPGDARAVEVDVERGGETVRHAEFRFASGPPTAITHRVRLTDGEYLLRVSITTPAGTRHVERPLRITESGTIVIPLGS